MTRVYLGLGSNVEPVVNLKLGIRELGKRFDLQAVSSVYRNKSIGFEGEDFLNAVACIETGVTPEELCTELDAIHDIAGRQRGADAFVSRTLDIDLLLYGDEIIDRPKVRVPRADVLQHSFVLGPLAEIAPEFIHPVTGRTIAEHWEDFDTASHPLSKWGHSPFSFIF